MPNGRPYDACPVCGGSGEVAYIVATESIRFYSTAPGSRNFVLVRTEDGDVGLYSSYCRKCGWIAFYCPPEALPRMEETQKKLAHLTTLDFADGRANTRSLDGKGLIRPTGP